MPTQQQERDFAFLMAKHTAVHMESLEDAMTWLRLNLDPEDIFSEKQLSNWAEANGYVKE